MNRSLALKADMALSDLASGGLLNAEQSNKFFENLIDKATILPQTRIVPMFSPQKEISATTFSSSILKSGSTDDGTVIPSANRSKPTFSKITLDAKKFEAEVNIPYSVLEDNIEKEQVVDTIIAQATRRLQYDLEDLIINGDTGGATSTYLDDLDGVLALATSNIYNAANSGISLDVLQETMKTLPTRFHQDMEAYKYFINPYTAIDFRSVLMNRATQLGDTTIVDGNYAYAPNISKSAAIAATDGFFVNPKNIVVGFHRDVMVETDKDIREQVIIVVFTVRLDVKIVDESGIVKITNIG